MTDFSHLEDRLRAYGRHPVDPPVQSQHLSALIEVPAARPSRIAHKVRVATALVAGFFIGSTGLAFAGALPAKVQDAASDTLAKAGIHVPVGTERFQGDANEPCAGGPWKNHGQYVKAQPKDQRDAASASRCGKPLTAGEGDDAESTELESDEPKAEHENNGRGGERDPNECATDGQANAAAAQERNKEDKGRPDTAGKPEKSECKPEADADDADADASTESEPATEAEDAPESVPAEESESAPVEAPVGPPADAGQDTGESQGVSDKTPGADVEPEPEVAPAD